jgi:hypothetical protein
MNSDKLFKNVLLAFIFFFIGRFIVLQMGNVGYWIVAGLVIAFYVAWFILGRYRSSIEKEE